MCTKNTALGDVSQDKYSTRFCLVLYLSLDMPPHAVFFVQTHSSALSNIKSVKAWHSYKQRSIDMHTLIKPITTNQAII